MKPQRKRALALAASAAAFLAAFLVASGMPPFQVTLAAGGLTSIAGLLIALIALQERSDAKAAAKTKARNRAVEADDRQRAKWEASLR